jgi:hypothetical protein
MVLVPELFGCDMNVSLATLEYLFVADLQFRQQFLLLHLNAIFSLVGKIALIHLETPEIEKGLHNVYKDSCIGKNPLRKHFTVDLPC